MDSRPDLAVDSRPDLSVDSRPVPVAVPLRDLAVDSQQVQAEACPQVQAEGCRLARVVVSPRVHVAAFRLDPATGCRLAREADLVPAQAGTRIEATGRLGHSSVPC